MKEIHAVIAVRYTTEGGLRTYYVKRSDHMENYPGVWSLMSIQFTRDELPDHLDLAAVQPVMQRLSDERLGGVSIETTGYITSTICSNNPIDARVFLHLYRVELGEEPTLAPEFYTDAAWLEPEEYMERAKGGLCGSCMRAWSDFCVNRGITDVRFAAPITVEADEEV